jgi:hypothetical protein
MELLSNDGDARTRSKERQKEFYPFFYLGVI